MSLKILFILSAPHQDLSLDESYRKIEKAIQSSSDKRAVQIIPKFSSRIEDLIEALNKEQPDIIHFSGHGNEQGELIFTGDDIENKAISLSTLANLFKINKDNVKLIFLDACHSLVEADKLSQEIDYVIGMNNVIHEETASTFATSFYSSFVSNRTVKEAFGQAKVILEVKHQHESKVPELLINDSRTEEFNISQFSSQPPKPVKNVTNVIKGNLYGVNNIEKGASATFNIEKNEKQKNITHHGAGDIVMGNKNIHNKDND
jgi:hypothetical protein